MALSILSSRRMVRAAIALSVLPALLAGVGCIDIVGADINKYVEREEKRFSTTGTPEVALSTFDGSIEIRAWDKPEVEVIVEKRASSKEAAQEIEILAEQNGNQVTVDVKAPKPTGFAAHFSRSAKLIVSMPSASNVVAKSGDGAIDLARITGRVDLRTGDGSIRGRDLAGDVKAHTGDGPITLEGLNGTLDVDTGDGTIVASGRLSVVQARTGDGAMTIHAETGSSPTGDWNLKTGDGSVTLELPDGFNGELDAHTGDGGIRMNDVTLSNVTGTVKKNTVQGRLGSGGPAVRVRTGDGSITLRRF
jgi:DUF4097 and DUF4098 domain-containing protein YvlB